MADIIICTQCKTHIDPYNDMLLWDYLLEGGEHLLRCPNCGTELAVTTNVTRTYHTVNPHQYNHDRYQRFGPEKL